MAHWRRESQLGMPGRLSHFSNRISDQDSGFSPPSCFVSSSGLSVVTDTGMFRALDLRLETSLSCERNNPPSVSPTPCPGKDPFNAHFPNANFSDVVYAYAAPISTVRVSAPENTSTLWQATMSRQGITEEYYTDLQNHTSRCSFFTYPASLNIAEQTLP